MSQVIDFHGHILNQAYLDLLEKHGATREDGFPLPRWNEEEALAFLDSTGIDWQLLSLSSPHPFFGDAAESASFCRDFNDFCSQVVRRHPKRFGFCATLPLPDVAAAQAEARRAIVEQGALGVKLASNSRGLYLGDEHLDPLFETLEELACEQGRKLICLIHPSRPAALSEGIFSAGPVPLFEFLADTTRAVLNMIARDLPRRFAHVAIVVPHCGSFLPNVAGRIEGAAPILQKTGMLGAIDVRANLERLYFDTAGDPTPYLLPLLLTIARPDQVVYGSDYPFTPAAKVRADLARLKQFLDSNGEFAPHAQAILATNAAELRGDSFGSKPR